MAFDLAVSSIIAAITISLLIAMGVRNRRSGYRRERTDIPADIVMLSAAVTASNRLRGYPPPPAPSAGDQASSDLMALNAFVGIAQPVVTVDDVAGEAIADSQSQATADASSTGRNV